MSVWGLRCGLTSNSTIFKDIGKDATSDAAELLKAVYLQHKHAAGDINRYLLTEDATAELMAYHNAKEVQIGELLRSGEAGYNERKMHIGSLSKASVSQFTVECWLA